MRSVATPGAVGLVAALLVTTVPPLPAAETFVHGAGLRIQLTVRKQTLEAFEDPNFTVRFENVGSKGIYLSPAVASNIHIYDEHGALVAPIAPTPHSVAERIGFRIRKSELIHLPPGRHWSAPVRPERSPGGAYTLRHPSDQTERFALRAGRYTARFVYVAYPGYSAHYDPYEIRNIWEGRQESEPVTFSVAPGAEAAIEGVELTARAFRQTYPDPIATITDLERQLASDEQNTVAAAASAVRGRNSKASIPALLPLLKDSRAWKRYIATSPGPPVAPDRRC